MLVMTFTTFPDRQRCTPVAFASQCPIDIVGKPVAKTASLDVTRVPVDGVVKLHHAVFKLAGADVPGWAGIIQQRGAAAPAEGVGVGIFFAAQEQTAGMQLIDDARIGCLDKNSSPRPYRPNKNTIVDPK